MVHKDAPALLWYLMLMVPKILAPLTRRLQPVDVRDLGHKMEEWSTAMEDKRDLCKQRDPWEYLHNKGGSFAGRHGPGLKALYWQEQQVISENISIIRIRFQSSLYMAPYFSTL